MKIKRNTNYYTIACLTMALTLSACGSGGGSGPSVMPSPPVQPEKEQPQQPEEMPQPPAKPEAEAPQQPKPEEIPQSPAPQPPVAPKPEQPQQPPKPEDVPQQPDTRLKADQEALSKLEIKSPHSGGVLSSIPLKLVINDNNRKVELQVLPPHSFVGMPNLETLRDSDGKLIGYYGHVRYSEQSIDINKEEQASLREYFLQDIDTSTKQQPEGMGDIVYQGKMIYRYDSNRNHADEALVKATYHGRDKTLGMRITTKNQDIWTLHNGKTQNSPAFVSVGEDGSIGGHLMFTHNQDSKPKFNGQFTGGLYGKNGSVLAGEASFEDRENGWKGVVGATAVPAPEKP